MKIRFAKIALFLVITAIVMSCDAVKRVPKNKKLLSKAEILVNSKPVKTDEVVNQLYQKPNSTFLGYRLRLNLYNMAKPKADSSYNAWLNKSPNRKQFLTNFLSKKQVNRLGSSFLVAGLSDFMKSIGEQPVLFDAVSSKKSANRLRFYYYNKGFFDVKCIFNADSVGIKRQIVKYNVILGNPYIIDDVSTKIESPKLDSIYKAHSVESFLKSKKQYNTEDLNAERARIYTDFRNNGVADFQPDYVSYDIDTIGKNKNLVDIKLKVKNFAYSVNDTLKTTPFKVYKISKVAVFTDKKASKKDSLQYKGLTFYFDKKLKYTPKSIANAIFINPGDVYSDINFNLTKNYINNLRIFNPPAILFKTDSKETDKLIASLYLNPRKKYSFNFAFDLIHSNIQDFGIQGNTSVGIRNVFDGAETFEIGLRGNLGASKSLSNPNNTFFNVSEFGIDTKLNFPRILFLFSTARLIPKRMIPSTSLTAGFSKQTNIGLDKQNFTSTFTYNFTPKPNTTVRFDLFNIQFVKNVNVDNYFNIYKSSYDAINRIAQNSIPTSNQVYFENGDLRVSDGVENFIDFALAQANPLSLNSNTLKDIRSINERKTRLTENNLIVATNISFTKTTKSKDKIDENFYAIKAKVESAGAFLSLFAGAVKELNGQPSANTFFDVEYSQYAKAEFEYIKHWDLGKKNVLAIRTFSGFAVPYKNSKSIPFSRSYFSGGSNDNRAWQPYSLGPGSSGGINDFNEANLKLSFNSEFRFNLVNKFNGAVFADFGNIWNYLDNVTDVTYKFKGLDSLKEIAIGSGFGLRYDQGLFVIRGDLGFKTYNPTADLEQKWFRELNFSKSVINIGINYPF